MRDCFTQLDFVTSQEKGAKIKAELVFASCSTSSYVGVVAKKKAERKCQEMSPILGPIHFRGAATAVPWVNKVHFHYLYLPLI